MRFFSGRGGPFNGRSGLFNGRAGAFNGRDTPPSGTAQPPFSPADLFTTGQGIWYQPDPAYLYEGRTGTAPAVVGGPVGQMLDRSGGNRHAVAPSDSARPTLRQNAAGLYYLEFDGVDDYMVIDGTVLVNVEYFVSAAWSTRSPANGILAVYASSSGATNQNLIFGWRGTMVYTLDQYANAVDMATPQRDTSTDVWSGLLDSTGHKIRRNGVQGAANTNTVKVTALANFTIGRFSVSYPLEYYGGILIGRSLSADELTQTERWLGGRIGKAL